MSDIVTDFQGQSAQNQALGDAPTSGADPVQPRNYPQIPETFAIEKPNEYVAFSRAMPGLDDHASLMNANKSQLALISRNMATPSLDRSFNELVDVHDAVTYASILSGLDRYYTTRNLSAIIQRLYPNSADSPKKFVENVRSLSRQVDISQWINAYASRQAEGDNSQYIKDQIAALQMQLMSFEELEPLIPDGQFGQWWEQAAYEGVRQGRQLQHAAPSAIWGTLEGAAWAAALYMTGGLAGAPVAAGLGGGAVTAGGSAIAAQSLPKMLPYFGAGAKAFRMKETWEHYANQNRGATWLTMTSRLMEEDPNFDEAAVAQASAIIGGLTAAVQLVEFEGFEGIFRGSGLLTKSFYKVSGTEKFMGNLLNGMASRLRGMPGTMGAEVVAEITEELVETFLTEWALARMTDDEIDISMEELGSQIATIANSTIQATMMLGLGLGAAGSLVDASIASGRTTIHGMPKLNREERTLLNDLPSMRDVKFNYDRKTQNISLENISDEQIKVNGQQVYDTVMKHPDMQNYISPAQKAVLAEYVRREAITADLSRGIAAMTGKTLSEIEGLTTFEYQSSIGVMEAVSNFEKRMAFAGEAIFTDGTKMPVTMEDGSEFMMSINQVDDNVTITVELDGGSKIGTMEGTLDTSGALKIKKIDASEFDQPANFPQYIDALIDNNLLFADKETAMTLEEQNLLREADNILRSDPSLSALSRIDEIVEDLQQRIQDPVKAPGSSGYTREINIPKDVKEYYWDEEVIEEEVPIKKSEPWPGTPEPEPTPQPEPPPDPEVAERMVPGATRYLEQAQKALNDFRDMYEQMEENNLEATAKGEPPPHDLEGTLIEMEKYEKAVEEYAAFVQQQYETFDRLEVDGIAPVEEDVAFVEDLNTEINRTERMRTRMLEKDVAPDQVQNYAETRYRDIYQALEGRLTQRRAENARAIREGEMATYNVGPMLLARDQIMQRLGLPEESARDTVRFLQSIQGSEMHNLDLIQESINAVFEKYQKDPAFKDRTGMDRKAAIVEAHRNELSVETQRRYAGKKITSLNLVELTQDRLQLYGSIQEMNDTKTVRNARMVSPELRARGVATPLDTMRQTPIVQETQIEDGPVETERQRNTRPVRKQRTVKKMVSSKIDFYEPSDTKAAARAYVLQASLDKMKDFLTAARGHSNQQVDVIRSIVNNTRTKKAQEYIEQLAINDGLSVFDTDQSGAFKEGNMEGATDIERRRFAERSRKTLDKLKRSELNELYKEVVGVGREEVRTAGVQVGDYEIAPNALINMIAQELKGAPMYGKNGENIHGDFARSFFRMYDHTLSLSVLSEKVMGRDSLFHKVFYEDINNGWLAQQRFMTEFEGEFGAKFNNLPGVKKPNSFYTETVAKIGGYELTRDKLLVLLQHHRNEYNWNAIKNNGLTVAGKYEPYELGMDTTEKIVDFVENYIPDDAEERALNIFQEGMDRLYQLGNAYSQEVRGAPLDKREFYIRIRPEFFEHEGKTRYEDSSRKVDLWTDVANIQEVTGIKRPVRLVGMGYEFDYTAKNLSAQYFVSRQFVRAETVMNADLIESSMTNRFHRDFFKLMKDGLERWRGRTFQQDIFSRMFDGARANFTAASLGLNLEVAAKQTLSFPLFAGFVDPKYLLQSAYETSLTPQQIDAHLKTWSTQYLIRGGDVGSMDVKDSMERQNNRLQKGSREMKRFTFGPIRVADRITVRSGMWAAFKQVHAEIEKESFSELVKSALDIDDSIIPHLTADTKNMLAAKYADYVLERTQPMAQEQHQSYFQRKSALTRTFSMFSGFTNQANMLMYRMGMDWNRRTPGAGKAFATTMFMTMLIMPAMSGLFDTARRKMHEAIRDEETEDPWMKMFVSDYFNSVTGYWFIARDAARYVNNYVQRGHNANNIVDVPFFEIMELYYKGLIQMIKAMNPNNTKAVRENNASHMAQNLQRAFFYTTGLPNWPMKLFRELMERGEQ